MKKTAIYKYLGTNGTIESPVHLEDIYYVKIYILEADEDKILTNGEEQQHIVRVPEDEVENWEEIPEGQE